MATDDQRHRRPKPSYARKSSVTLPSPIPRSQYANNTQTKNVRPETGDAGPKYFSSPYRAPLNPQERQQSFVEHQKAVSSVYSNDTQTPPDFPYHDERSSYSIFGPGPAVESVPIVMRTNSPMRYRDLSPLQPTYYQEPGVVRQASIGHKAKPALTTVRRSGSTRDQTAESAPETPGNLAASALHAAVASAFSQNPAPNTTYTSQRPLDSPTSSYSQNVFHDGQHEAPSTANPLFSTPPPDRGRVSPLPPNSEKSATSSNPLLDPGLERPGMKNRNPEKQRPPRLDMEAVRRAEARGSITSLPDLIRRATRLAANLDHGRTASTFSVFDMFRSYERGNAGNRRSTHSDMNDMLAAFPKPTNEDSVDRCRPNTMWPGERKGEVFFDEKSAAESGSSKRRCCGLSTTTIVIIIVVFVLLCAAAVLIPIFLVVVPGQHRSSTDLSKCATEFPCQNGGISVVDNNTCSCVCVDGFNTNDCSSPGVDCVTVDSQSFKNATVGRLIEPLLIDATAKFNIALNSTIILSTFASQNVSCPEENFLVQFQSITKQQNKRLLAGPETARGQKATAHPWQVDPQDVSGGNTPAVLARQNIVQTTNSIVYQTSLPQASATQTGSPTSTGSTTPALYTNMPSGKNLTASVPADQLEFAGVVVLYVLSVSRTSSTAVWASQQMEQYLRAGGLLTGRDTVNVTIGGDHPTLANFADLAIVLGDGTVIGGNRTKT